MVRDISGNKDASLSPKPGWCQWHQHGEPKHSEVSHTVIVKYTNFPGSM